MLTFYLTFSHLLEFHYYCYSLLLVLALNFINCLQYSRKHHHLHQCWCLTLHLMAAICSRSLRPYISDMIIFVTRFSLRSIIRIFSIDLRGYLSPWFDCWISSTWNFGAMGFFCFALDRNQHFCTCFHCPDWQPSSRLQQPYRQNLL